MLRQYRCLLACVVLFGSLSGCCVPLYPMTYSFYDESIFRDNVIDHVLKNFGAPMFGQRVKGQLLAKFPIGSSSAEAVQYLANIGSRCKEMSSGRTGSELQKEVECTYDKRWPYEVYALKGICQDELGEKIASGEAVVVLLMTVVSRDETIMDIKVYPLKAIVPLKWKRGISFQRQS